MIQGQWPVLSKVTKKITGNWMRVNHPHDWIRIVGTRPWNVSLLALRAPIQDSGVLAIAAYLNHALASQA
jgi:hypothetical protein